MQDTYKVFFVHSTLFIYDFIIKTIQLLFDSLEVKAQITDNNNGGSHIAL